MTERRRIQEQFHVLHEESAFSSQPTLRAPTMLDSPRENTRQLIHTVAPKSDENGETLQSNSQLNRCILQLIGVWPKFNEASPREKYLRYLLNATCSSLIAFILVPSMSYLMLEVDDLYQQVRLSGPLSFYFMAAFKYCFLVLRQGKIRMCIESIHTERKDFANFHKDEQKVMIERDNFTRRILLTCAIFMYSGALFYYVVLPFVRGKIVDTQSNVTYRALAYSVAGIIVDVRQSPANEIFLVVQCFAGFAAHSITVGSCGLAASFAMHACGQLQVVMLNLENLVDGQREDSRRSFKERFSDLVKRYVRTLNFIRITVEILQEVSLVEVVGCTLNMCLLGYYCISEWNANEVISCLTYIVLLISLTFNIFIFCYIGEILAEQCERIGEKSYTIDWYRLPGENRRNLILMIIMANSSPRLTAGHLIELSLSSFADVIKSSMVYLNALITLTQ